jgi:hypothetical protein
MVVIFLLTTNITPSNGSLVRNGKNDTSLNNLMTCLISNGGSVIITILILTLIAAIRFKDKINKIIV